MLDSFLYSKPALGGSSAVSSYICFNVIAEFPGGIRGSVASDLRPRKWETVIRQSPESLFCLKAYSLSLGLQSKAVAANACVG
jgi:hypothetical protein